MSTKATKNTTNNANVVNTEAANVAEVVEVQETEATEVEEAEVISGVITKVMLPEGNDERVSFVLDKEFETIDFKTGEVKRTNIFGMNIYAVVNQVGPFVSYIQLADALAMGKMINPQIISLSMLNAEVKIKREDHEAGEKRKNTEDVYARNCKTTDFVNVKPNIKPIFEQMLMQLISKAPAIVKAPAVPNPFGM